MAHSLNQHAEKSSTSGSKRKNIVIGSVVAIVVVGLALGLGLGFGLKDDSKSSSMDNSDHINRKSTPTPSASDATSSGTHATSHAKSTSTSHAKSTSTSHAKSTSTSHAKSTSTSHAKSTSTSHAKSTSTSHAKPADGGNDAIYYDGFPILKDAFPRDCGKGKRIVAETGYGTGKLSCVDGASYSNSNHGTQAWKEEQIIMLVNLLVLHALTFLKWC